MWPFRNKGVVHVDVRQYVNQAGQVVDKTCVGAYHFVGDPLGTVRNTSPIKARPFLLSHQVRRAVQDDLPSHMNKKQKKQTVVKVWLDDSILGVSRTEQWITIPIVIFALFEVALLITIGVLGIFIDTETVEPLLPGTAIASLAVNAAYFLGNLTTRHLKIAKRFEYDTWKVTTTYGFLALSIAANGAVLAGWPAAWFPDQIQVAERTATVLAAGGLMVAALGSLASGAIDVLKWALIEEVQRRSKSARVIGDIVEKRERVRA